MKILNDSLNIEAVNRYKRVFVLTEKGCMSCNRSFSNFIEKELDEESLCIVNASGRMVDISYYQQNKSPNIVFDYDYLFINNNVIETSSIFYMKNNEVDTIVELDVQELGSQLEFFKSVVE